VATVAIAFVLVGEVAGRSLFYASMIPIGL
jgi:hypothetical protein